MRNIIEKTILRITGKELVRRFLTGDFFFSVTNRAFYAFKLVIAPQREEIESALVGMTLTTRGEVPRPSVARISD